MIEIKNLGSLSLEAYKGLEALEKVVFEHEGTLYDHQPWELSNFIYELPNKQNLSFVAFSNEKIIGFSIAYLFKPFWGHISRFAVSPNHVGKKVGLKLFEKQLDEMRNQRVNKITVDLIKKNEKALRFYERNKFETLKGKELESYILEREREKSEYLSNQPSHIAMQKSLNGIN